MVIFSANMDKENEDGWDFVTEFYVFKTDVGYDTKPYSVSKDQGPKSRSSEVNRIIQEGKMLKEMTIYSIFGHFQIGSLASRYDNRP